MGKPDGWNELTKLLRNTDTFFVCTSVCTSAALACGGYNGVTRLVRLYQLNQQHELACHESNAYKPRHGDALHYLTYFALGTVTVVSVEFVHVDPTFHFLGGGIL
jgi:hypothetical protein